MASYSADKVQTSGAAAATYKDEMGIPAIKSGTSELTVRGGAAGTETALYAYATTPVRRRL